MSGWIPVGDRLPQLDSGMSMDVWTFDGDWEEGVRLEVWSTENSDEGEFVNFEAALEHFEAVAPRGDPDCVCIPPKRPTHWMEVEYPAPPK